MATWRSGTVNSLSSSAGSNATAARTITAGDLVVVCVTWEDSQTLSSVSDTAGGIWVIATQQAQGAAPAPIGAIAYCLSHPGGSTTITATLSGSANPLIEMDVLCFTPAAGKAFAFDVAMTPVTGASSASFTGNAMSTAATGVVVEFLAGFQLTVGVATGGTPTFTRDTATENASGRSFAQYLLNSTATVTPGGSWSAPASKYVLLAASFKEVGSGSSGVIRKAGPGIGGPNARNQFKARPPAFSSQDVTVNLTGQSLTLSQGTLTAYSTSFTRIEPRPLGPGVRPFNNNQFLTPPRSTSAPPVSPDVTVNLTGAVLAVSAGTLIPASALSVTGLAVTTSQGTITPQTSVALSGTAIALSMGTLSPTSAVFLNGQQLTLSQGTFSVSVGSDVTVNLTGQSLAFSQGALVPAVDVPVSGQSLTTSQGALSPNLAPILSGQSLTLATDSLTASITGDVTVALIGQTLTLQTGTFGVDGADSTGPAPGVNGGGGGGSIDRRVRRKLDRKLNKILDDVVAEVVYKDLVTTDKAKAAAKVVKPFVETKTASVPEPAAVDWDSLTRNAKAVGALLQMWRAIERQREIEADDEEWLMF